MLQDYNGGGRSSSSERGSSSLEAKKAKLDEYLPPQQQMSSEDSYRLLLYQAWAASSAASTGAGKATSVAANPAAAAAAAAWSSHYAQAIKVNYARYCIIDSSSSLVEAASAAASEVGIDPNFQVERKWMFLLFQDGKAPMAPPAGFSMPPPRPSSSAGHNGSYHRNYEAKMISPSSSHHHHHSDSRLLVKSSPMSDHAESPSERLAQSKFERFFGVFFLLNTTALYRYWISWKGYGVSSTFQWV